MSYLDIYFTGEATKEILAMLQSAPQPSPLPAFWRHGGTDGWRAVGMTYVWAGDDFERYDLDLRHAFEAAGLPVEMVHVPGEPQ